MNKKRYYEDGCAFAQVLDLVGDRWAMLVIRELTFAPKRFSDLRRGLPGIAPNVLTRRVVDLEAAGVLRRIALPRPARGQAYELTKWGRDFREVIRVMGAWAARSPHLTANWPMSPSSAMLSLTSLFDPTRAAPLALEVHLGEEVFGVKVQSAHLAVTPGSLAEAECTIRGDQNDFMAILDSDAPARAAHEDEALQVEGDAEALSRLSSMLRRPTPAPL